MSVFLRPILADEVGKTGKRIFQTYSKGGAELVSGLTSKGSFGQSGSSGKYQNRETEVLTAHILFPVPVINKVLAGKSGESLGNLLGIENQQDIKGLCDYSKVLYKSEDGKDNYKIVSIANIPEGTTRNQILLGGKAIEYLINNRPNHEEIVRTAIINTLAKETSGEQEAEQDEMSRMKRFIADTLVKGKPGPEAIRIIDDYYLDVDDVPSSVITRIQDFRTSIENSGLNRVKILLTTKDIPTKLKGMLMYGVIITPLATRPSLESQVDPTTKLYAEVLKYSNLVAESTGLKDSIVHELNILKAFQTKVDELILESNQKDLSTKSFTEKLSGKHALIRSTMLKKRQDYSGRSTITVDPTLRITECVLPAEMIDSLYSAHLIKRMNLDLETYESLSQEERVKMVQESGLLREIPCILNRAPTLHKLSMLGFFPKVGKDKTIHLNPLVCAGFNADFDGDQMAVHVPISYQAIQETKELILASKNIFHPATGESTLLLKQEMIYGLHEATRQHEKAYNSGKSYTDLEELYKDVFNHKTKVYEIVSLNGKLDTAGRYAFSRCIPKAMRGNIYEVNKRSIKKYIKNLEDFDEDVFVTALQLMTLLGFRLATLYAPTVSILKSQKNDYIKQRVREFEKRSKKLNEIYLKGFITDEDFESKFSTHLEELKADIEDNIIDILGEDNGYVKLVQSGARGDKGNLIQIYGYKGQIKKSDTENFKTIIGKGFLDILSPMEHFQSAYGSRSGMTDKVSKTADTGYTDRLLFDGASDEVVTNKDCKTKEGIKLIRAGFISDMHDEVETSVNNQKAINKIAKIIKGRYIIVGGVEVFINTEEDALGYASRYESIIMRSPITCKAPCCQKCYGIDLGTNRLVRIGSPIGYIAGQSIGEPGTQLTMKTFHKGGVAGKTVTSDFDRLNVLLKMQCNSIEQHISDWDPVAWDSGDVYVVPIDSKSNLVWIGNNKKKRVLDSRLNIKSHVEVGEGLKLDGGLKRPDELIKYASFEEGVSYLLRSIYSCYEGKVDVNYKHFEVIISAMIMYCCIETNGSSEFSYGSYYSKQDLLKKHTPIYLLENTPTYLPETDRPILVKKILGINDVPVRKESLLSNIALERVKGGLVKGYLQETREDMDYSMSRMMMGLPPISGTELNPRFLIE